MKSWSMRASRALLSFLLVGMCQAHLGAPSSSPSTSQEAGEVPVSQLRMLSRGLANLLQGVVENAEQLERQGEQVAAELDGATKSLESLRKQSLQTGRTHRQVRKDLQILRAKEDRLWRVAKDLQKGMEDLEKEQEAMQHQTNQILQKVKSLTELRFGGQMAQLDVGAIKVTIDKKARRLALLNSVISAQDRIIDRRHHYIDHLEEQVSESLPAALRADSDSDCV